MIHLGGKARYAGGRLSARAKPRSATAPRCAVFFKMIDAQGGDVSVFDDPASFHKPGATRVVEAWESGFVAAMDTTALGWAVQRTGAGREKAGEPVDPHAGIVFHARRGARVEAGQPIATLYATNRSTLAEPAAILNAVDSLLRRVRRGAAVPLVSRIFTRECGGDNTLAQSQLVASSEVQLLSYCSLTQTALAPVSSPDSRRARRNRLHCDAGRDRARS